MLRLACIMGVEAGTKICAPVHDAILIEAPSDALDEQVRIMQGLMAKASAIVLGGFELRSDVKIIASPERYLDPRGKLMWEKVMVVAANGGGQNPACPTPAHQLSHGDTPVQSNIYIYYNNSNVPPNLSLGRLP